MIRRTRVQVTVAVAATTATLLAAQGRVLSQEQVEPVLPLEQVAYIKASNAEPYDHFACGGVNPGHTGNSIALSGDGNTMAIGAPFESSAATGINGNQNDNSAYASGAVYVYVRQGDSWSQSGYVKASNAGQSDHFGASVALSRDGSTMAVSAHWESSAANSIDGNQADNSIPHAGAVYIFTRAGNTWTQQAYVKASNTGSAPPGDGDQFGYSIALSGDGNRLAVGAIDEDSAAQGIDGDQQDNSQPTSGAVYVFTRNGGTWAQEAYAKGSHVEGRDLFGFSVALNFSGDTLVAGAFDESGASRTINGPHDNDAGGSGALFVFTRQDGAWSEQAYIKGSRNEESDQMGYAVDISDDGNTIAVGVGDEACLTPGINPPGCAADRPAIGGANIWVGAAYVFVRNGAAWAEQAFIKANNPRPYNSFGSKLALSGDGDTLAVGAYLEDNAGQGVRAPEIQPFLTTEYLNPWRDRQNQADESGAVYVYTRSDGAWTLGAYVKGTNTDAGDEFGSAVALSADGRTMVVGAHQEDSAARDIDGNQTDNSVDDSGAAYVFAR